MALFKLLQDHFLVVADVIRLQFQDKLARGLSERQRNPNGIE